MIENFNIPKKSKAFLFSIVCERLKGHHNESETQKSLNELRELLRTLDVQSLDHSYQTKKKLDAGTILGKGKLLEIADKAHELKADFLVCDFELTAGQVKNIKKITGLEVIDRCSIILEIFAQHARTREAKIQIEISRLQYLLPRLTTLWGHFSKKKGGIGHMGGEGEQQLELDRRIVRNRIEFFKKQLKNIVTSREQQNKKRKNNVITAALVGHTNVGKSSLMNKLCQVNILVQDQLFATLDSTCRTLTPDSRPPVVLIDTVGLISNLPATLITGFKTTLESALEADLLIIVSDVSDQYCSDQLEVTHKFLEELGIDHKNRIYVFNKKDKLCPSQIFQSKILMRSYHNSFLVSSHDTQDMSKLREFIMDKLLEDQEYYDLFIPYEKGDLHSQIMSKSNIVEQSYHKDGIFYRVKIPDFMFGQLGIEKYILGPHELEKIEKKK